MYKIVTFSPRELFDKVWETPVLKLAQEIGISDVALSKACRKAGLPLPPRGHWAKPVSKRPSKPVPPTDEHPIRFTVLDRGTLPIRSTVPPLSKAVRSAIEVPHTLLAPHPLVSKWLKCVYAAKPHEGHLVTTGRNVLDAKISAELIDRCALIFDTLIKESEVLGFKWNERDDDWNPTPFNDCDTLDFCEDCRPSTTQTKDWYGVLINKRGFKHVRLRKNDRAVIFKGAWGTQTLRAEELQSTSFAPR